MFCNLFRFIFSLLNKIWFYLIERFIFFKNLHGIFVFFIDLFKKGYFFILNLLKKIYNFILEKIIFSKISCSIFSFIGDLICNFLYFITYPFMFLLHKLFIGIKYLLSICLDTLLLYFSNLRGFLWSRIEPYILLMELIIENMFYYWDLFIISVEFIFYFILFYSKQIIFRSYEALLYRLGTYESFIFIFIIDPIIKFFKGILRLFINWRVYVFLYLIFRFYLLIFYGVWY